MKNTSQQYLNSEAHGYLMEAKACKLLLKDLERIRAKLKRHIEKEAADRKAEFEAAMQYHSESDIQEAYGWEFISEQQYERYLELFRQGRKALDEHSPTVTELALSILNRIFQDIDRDCSQCEFEALSPEEQLAELKCAEESRQAWKQYIASLKEMVGSMTGKTNDHTASKNVAISTYPNGNLAIKLYEKDHGILIFWETLTTNLTGIRPDYCAFINIKAADGLFPVWLSDNHLAEPTGQILESDGCLYPEYLFNGKELDALDHEGHTLYIRRQKGELGRRFERLYLALRRLAREINGFSYTDYSGWRCLDGSSSTLPLWIEAFDPSHGRKFIFTQKGPALQTTILYADGTEKQRIYRRKEDMATELMAMFQEELRVYPPWSEDRRKRYEY